MLDALTATRFDRPMNRGRTSPLLLEGETDVGSTVEVVAKFTSPQLSVEGLIREAFGAMLGADLGLPVPACYCVEVTTGFIASVAGSHSEVAAALTQAVPIGFGSAKLPPGFAAWMPQRSLPEAMRRVAAEIYAFDLLIQNPDRRPDNPNLQLKGNDFAIFDHEMALVTEGILSWRPPWELGALAAANAPQGHVLYRALQGTRPDLTRLSDAWVTVDAARLWAYRTTLPPVWTATAQAAHTADTLLSFLSELRQNIEPAMQEIKRTLT